MLADVIWIAVAILGAIGAVAAVLLYMAARKFHVHEDPRIGEIEALLPGANCGGCGLTGCHAFAVQCASASSLEGLNCTGVDAKGMEKIAAIAGLTASARTRRAAVVRCAATCDVRDTRNRYDGIGSCRLEAASYQGESDCVYGCLGGGDCVRACPFGAIAIAPGETLPRVDRDRCTGCGKCAEACPRGLCTLVPVHEGQPTVWVACANRDRGPVAMKECPASCIGCTKCRKVCPVQAPVIESFLATVDQGKCTACGECVKACPRKSIVSV